MSLYEIIFLAIVLSIDAFLVSFSYGTANLKNRDKTAISIATGVGLFQGIMPLLGALFVNLFLEYIKNYAQYFAGIIFMVLGIKLLIEANKQQNPNEDTTTNKIIDITFKTILILSVATSIDAFAAGSSLGMLKVNICLAVIIIGIITFINSLIGFYLGVKISKLSPRIIGSLGGILLFLIGIKTIFL